MFENHSRKKYPITLKFDCQKMKKREIEKMAGEFLTHGQVQIIGGNVIYFKGNVTDVEYGKVWAITDKYDVIID